MLDSVFLLRTPDLPPRPDIGDPVRDLATAALETARLRGASYADVRVIQERRQSLMVKNGQLAEIEESETLGCGVRVIADGAWGFASRGEAGREAAQRAAASAVAVARASAMACRTPVRLAAQRPAVGRYASPVRIDPFSIPLGRKVDDLMAVDGALRAVAGVTVAETSLSCRDETKL